MTTTATVSQLPNCNFCSEKAEYDFKTGVGPWAYGCRAHYQEHRLFGDLGLGKGQKLVLDAPKPK